MKKLLLLCFVLSVWIFACGSETNGTLTLAEITVTDLTGGNFSVNSSAILLSSAGKALPDSKISYIATFKRNNIVIDERHGDKLPTDPTGKIDIGPFPVSQDTVPIIITITATSDGLSATKTASIAAS